MASAIKLQTKPQRLLDHTDSDIIDRYRDYLLEDPGRHLWLGKSILIDVDEVIRRRFVCDTRLCLRNTGTPKVKTRYSCCWDLEVQLLPTEIDAIEKHLDKVIEHHPALQSPIEKRGFWKYDAEWWKILQKKKNGSCIFLNSCDSLGQHACALHDTALREGMGLGEIKPLICRMFPLFILETEETHIITCYGPNTHRVLFDDDYEEMRCLHDNRRATERIYIVMHETLETLVGKDGYRHLAQEAEKILARDDSNGHDG